MGTESIFGNDNIPKAVDFDELNKLTIDKFEAIPFEPVTDAAEVDEEPEKNEGKTESVESSSKPEEFKELEELAGIEFSEAIDAEGNSVFTDELTEEETDKSNGDDSATDPLDDPWNMSITEFVNATDITGFVEKYRNDGLLFLYEWRAAIKKVREYHKHLSGKQNRSDTEQKQHSQLTKFLENFGADYKALEDKIQWTEKYRNTIIRFFDLVLEKYGYKKVPFWVGMIYVEGKAIWHCATKDTRTDELPFSIPEDY